MQRKPPKSKSFVFPGEPLQSLGKKGQHSKKQGIPCFLEKKKSKEFQKSKERKIRGGVRDMSAAAMSLTPPGRPGGVCVCEREAFLS